ncbi:aminodeoxychorismate synthase component I [Bacillus ginsengihumi]|uniref:Aminodeoxychorismate synthase component I n=1 Tax=Heyndrickxia ginsengihumi TaxID=363870 RepID=A0A6M0P930_9BACI|nr:aminodeoxychorismate synthase component I [Heyndrickxia ginsengihumi]NEY21071.1 aminodeoxychorismate synthase component I [Heyndrickxia ginsengihumi]
MTVKEIHRNPLLLFEFMNEKGEQSPILFTQPTNIIVAYTIDEVLPCMLKIQEAVADGFFAAGYVSYEAAPAFDASYHVRPDHQLPLLWFGIFQESSVYERTESQGSYKVSEWKPSIYGDQYHDGILKIKEAIRQGDTYQVNFTTRMHAHFEGDDFSFYQKLAKDQDSNYCAYLNIGDYRILSASPELFFRWDGKKITTKPMKGTTARGKTRKEDEENATWLFHSEKNRAENIMIVDLLRNDLGNIAKTGTVKVEKLFDIEQYPTVLQMTSTITAMTKENTSITDIFSALFPCGSITGAPKISTMRLISELEDSPREVYCGAIGYIRPQGEAVFNVPIRTVTIDAENGHAVYGVGGGITWDSTTKDEYDEIVTKASLLTVERPTFDLLESLKLDNGIYLLLDRHLNRLYDSAQYFHFHVRIDHIKKSLMDYADNHRKGTFKVRLVVSKDGSHTITGEPIKPFHGPLIVALAREPIDEDHPFLYHKTTNRDVYNHFKTKLEPSLFDVVLWNKKGELTEFINGNLVLEIQDEFFTPKITSGLLAGTFREELIHEGKIKERVLTKQDLLNCSSIWFINSVREWVNVKLKEDTII